MREVKTIQRIVGFLLLTLAAAMVTKQFLIRPAVGLANNNDFVKMAGLVGLGPEDGTWESHLQYGDFIYRYLKADRYRYDWGFWSSEVLLIKLARRLQLILEPGPRFDIRWLGAVHASVLLLATGLWIFAPVARWKFLVGWLAVLIWTDVAYVQYLNSFYMDTVAIVFLALAVAAGLYNAENRNRRLFAPLTVAGVILFAVSKPQHALPSLVFVPLMLAFGLWSRARQARAAWLASSVILAGAAYLTLRQNPSDYRSAAVYNIVFLRIAPEAPDPLHALNELGLSSNELSLLRTSAFAPNGRTDNPKWVKQFTARCDYGSIARYYLRHRLVTMRFLYQGLSGDASRIRPWGNRSVDDGFKTGARETRFGYWSDFRGFLLRIAPWHMVLLVIGVLGGGLWLLLYSPRDRAFASLVLTVQTLAVTEYVVAILADAVETSRHLIVFHAATDISILLAPVLISKIVSWGREGKRAYPTS